TSAVVAGATDRLGSRDRKALRAQLELPDVLGAHLSFGYETSDSESGGYAFEFTKHVRQGARDFLREYDPNADFKPGNFTGSQETPSIFRREIDRFIAHASYDLGGWGLHALADRSQLDVTDRFDGDRTPAPFSVARTADEDPQTTFEIRVDSPSLEGFFGWNLLSAFAPQGTAFTAGIFYQQRRIDDSEFFIAIDPLVIAAGMAARNDGVPVPRPPDAEDETTTMFWEQKSNAVAGFSQIEWRFVDRLALTYGMRLSHEAQSAAWERVLSPNAAVLRAGNFENFTAEEDRSELAFTPKVSVVYDLTDNINVFANWANGFRAGGFNEFASNAEGRRDFDSETGTAWEVGTKAVILDGLARFDLGLYRQDVEDYQQLVESRGAVLTSIIVENAAEARSQGVEIDYSAFPASWLTVRGALALAHTEYLEFRNGPCEPDRPNTDGDDDPSCDLGGKPLPFAPRWTHTLTPSVQFPLTGLPGIDGAIGGITIEYQDVHFVSPAIDFRERQRPFFRLNGHIGIQSNERGWSLRLVGENLTDEVITVFTNTSTVGPGNLVQATRAPRLLFAKFRWAF
ncbi:MAG: TonB-dependent receptor, partial [Opitutaceae bacterium]